jgi:hypothetical protein
MVADLAGVYGKTLSDPQMIYCLFRHLTAQRLGI